MIDERTPRGEHLARGAGTVYPFNRRFPRNTYVCPRTRPRSSVPTAVPTKSSGCRQQPVWRSIRAPSVGRSSSRGRGTVASSARIRDLGVPCRYGPLDRWQRTDAPALNCRRSGLRVSCPTDGARGESRRVVGGGAPPRRRCGIRSRRARRITEINCTLALCSSRRAAVCPHRTETSAATRGPLRTLGRAPRRCD